LSTQKGSLYCISEKEFLGFLEDVEKKQRGSSRKGQLIAIKKTKIIINLQRSKNKAGEGIKPGGDPRLL